jgi:hypothetical protein
VATFPADGGHVGAIAADRLSALPPGNPRFVGGELVRRSLGMGRTAAFARDLTLFGRVHRRKPALAGIRHDLVSFGLQNWYRENNFRVFFTL